MEGEKKDEETGEGKGKTIVRKGHNLTDWKSDGRKQRYNKKRKLKKGQ